MQAHAVPVGSAVEGVDAGDDPPDMVLVVAHRHWVAVEVVSAGRVSIAVACTTSNTDQPMPNPKNSAATGLPLQMCCFRLHQMLACKGVSEQDHVLQKRLCMPA